MKVSDLQKVLRTLSEAIATSRGSNKDLTDAADALDPFGHHTMAEFAKFLQLARDTYADGKLPLKPVKESPPPKPPRPEKADKVTLSQLRAAMDDIRTRLVPGHALTRGDIDRELTKFAALKAPELEQVTRELGYQTKPKSRTVAVEWISGRLLAGEIAAARVQA